MNSFENAVELDCAAAAEASNLKRKPNAIRAEKIVVAALAYEALLENRLSILDAYINLFFLYWQSTEFGFHASIGLDLKFVKHAEERYPQILQTADECYPNEPEVQFWKLYFGFVIGDPPFEDECKRLVSRSGCPLVPFFFLYSQSNGYQYCDEAMKLLELCNKVPTLKNCYIKSVIDGVKNRLI